MAKEHEPPRGQQPPPQQQKAAEQHRSGRALEGTELPDDLRRTQQQAAKEPPPPVKHDPAKDELGAPADAPPVPPKAKPGPVPRVIDQSERSPDVTRYSRFKVKASGGIFDEQPYRYVLAAKGDRDGAVACYRETTGLQAVLDTFPPGQAPRPNITCKELVD